MYKCTMYEGCMIYRLAGFPIYAADNRPFKTKRTREDALFLPSYINFTSYILPSYINCTSYIVPSYISFILPLMEETGTVGVEELFERGNLFEQLLAFIGVADPHAFTGSGVLSFGR